ncbi:MAG TPA: cytochrome c biogenesis protein CcdA [Candidatus Aquilonibacter sp.]
MSAVFAFATLDLRAASPAAVAAAFGAGLSTSIGPCAAPRYLALTTLMARSKGRDRWAAAASFVISLFAAYAAIMLVASLVWRALALSPALYLVCAGVFLILGLRGALAQERCGHAGVSNASRRPALLLGVLSGLMFSPCCSPVALLIGGAGLASGSMGTAFVMMGAFLAGHIIPVVLTGTLTSALAVLLDRGDARRALVTINAGLMIALAGYYGLLA